MEKYGIKKDDWSMSGDVKYHLGTSMTRSYPDGRTVHLSLLANPSHLEAVNTVVGGKTRAKQFYMGDRSEDTKKVIPVLMHGDAAFAGQGIVYETMQLAKVREFATGGTIHIVVNNQVGFTTDPSSSRSTRYCTDLGKAFDIPIFHCNGDDPLSVTTAFELAVDWRQAWGEDCIIDVVCYRRHGHNELDQPLFTQPLLYSQIQKHPSTLEIYHDRLMKDGTATEAELQAITAEVHAAYDKAFEESKTWQAAKDDWLSSKWDGFKSPGQRSRVRETGIHADRLREIGAKIGSVPEGFVLHRQLEKILAARRKTVEEGKGIDWGTAEALAFGTLLLEGNHVRLTGQDVERGTFSHRHCVLHDQKTNETYTPLNHIRPQITNVRSTRDPPIPNSQARFIARNSILSEYGVLGFELGYSLENPNNLTLWEAQFGDFSNGAQVMIDQFIASGENKWLRQSGLVMLLPHGYDGQGPEHSSCRPERFLQMVDEDEDVIPPMGEEERQQIQHTNWQVVNCTTPANYYHVLRRQVHRDFRKPLIVIAPKNLLRHKLAVSNLEDMGEGTRFRRIEREKCPDIRAHHEKVTKVVFVTGKIYYELFQEREARGIKDTAIVRIEQLAPFPFDKVADELSRYPNVQKVVWCQEEPKNGGAYFYCAPRIRTASRDILNKDLQPIYVGRAPMAAPAGGLAKVHAKEQQGILDGVFAL
jgi:2-oxoglutarate dehydrogenase E1 component